MHTNKYTHTICTPIPTVECCKIFSFRSKFFILASTGRFLKEFIIITIIIIKFLPFLPYCMNACSGPRKVGQKLCANLPPASIVIKAESRYSPTVQPAAGSRRAQHH